MATYQHEDVVDTPAGRTAAVTRSRRFSPGQVLAAVVGLILGVMGLITVTRAGIDSSLNTPVVRVAGMSQSAIVGLVELGAGLLLLLSAADAAFRGVTGAIGALLIVGGVVVAAGSNSILMHVGTLHGTGWFLVVMGAIAVVAASLPSFVRTDRTGRSDAL